MVTATGLTAAELRVLEVALEEWTAAPCDSDIFTYRSDSRQNEVCRWVIDSFRLYLAAGCDEREFSKRLHLLVDILREHLYGVADFTNDEETVRGAEDLITRMSGR